MSQRAKTTDNGWIKWVVVLLIGLGTAVFSDIYFRVMEHTAIGVDPDTYDVIATVLIVIGISGFLMDSIE